MEIACSVDSRFDPPIHFRTQACSDVLSSSRQRPMESAVYTVLNHPSVRTTSRTGGKRGIRVSHTKKITLLMHTQEIRFYTYIMILVHKKKRGRKDGEGGGGRYYRRRKNAR